MCLLPPATSHLRKSPDDFRRPCDLSIPRRTTAPLPDHVICLYYTTDHLGSVREVVDSGGAVRASYDYSPEGKRTKVVGDLDCDFGFTGHYTHEATGLVAAPYRFYDAMTQRWLSRDPIEEDGGINLYGYGENRLTNAIDPLGLDTYRMNRQLNPFSKSDRDPRSLSNPLSHTFVCIADENKKVLATFSWGNVVKHGSNGDWNFNSPEDLSAAQKALNQGTGAAKVGGVALDRWIMVTGLDLLLNGGEHPWALSDSCKDAATKLITTAQERLKEHGPLSKETAGKMMQQLWKSYLESHSYEAQKLGIPIPK